MIRHMYIPEPPVSAFAETFWYLEERCAQVRDERSAPDGYVDLIVDLTAHEVRMANAANETLRPGSVFVCGPHTRHFVIGGSPETRVVGVRFRPGCAFPFLGVPLDLLLNAIVPLDAILGPAARDLRDELLEAEDVTRLFEVLERRLPQLAAKPAESHPAVRYAVERLSSGRGVEPAERIRCIVDETGLSHRRLIELFRRETGYTPKQFERVRRFQEALRKMHSDRPPRWPDLAAECGFSDQAHFIREFRAFSGLSPAAYEPVPGRDANHAPA